MKTRKIAIIIMLTALCIGTNYLLLPLYNVKFMDFIVFVSGFCFGPAIGGLIGLLSWTIYGTINPLGFSFPVWIATMTGEAIFGIVGGVARRAFFPKKISEIKDKLGAAILFGGLSLFLTLTYDLIANFAYSYAFGINFILAVIVGFVPFGIAHLVSNVVFFSVGCAPAINTVLKISGGEKTVNEK